MGSEEAVQYLEEGDFDNLDSTEEEDLQQLISYMVDHPLSE